MKGTFDRGIQSIAKADFWHLSCFSTSEDIACATLRPKAIDILGLGL
jgi:hypothetical protein